MKKFLLSLFAMLGVVLGMTASEVTVTFDATTDISPDGSTAGHQTLVKDGVTLDVANGLLGNGSQYRIYKGYALTASVEAGAITSIEFTCIASGTTKFGPGCFAEQEGYSYDGTVGTWSGSKSSVEFTAESNQVRATQIVVTYTVEDGVVVVAKPTLTASTTFEDEMQVEITSQDGLKVYYTTDGTDPEVSSATLYEGAFTISETTTVKAIAADDEGNASAVVEATYTKVEPLTEITIAEALTKPAGERVIVSGKVVAAGTQGFVLADDTDYIYFYAGSGNTHTVGQLLTVDGTLAAYKNTVQFTSTATVTENGTEDVTYPEATTLTGEDLDFAQENAEIAHQYVTYVGKLSINGNYYNLTVEGAATAVGSFIVPLEDLSELNGKDVVVEGYTLFVNGKYVYICMTKIEEYVEVSSFTVTVSADITGGTVQASETEATDGSTVTLTAEPLEGYTLESIVVKGEVSENEYELTADETNENVFTFTVNGENVVVTATFAEEFQPVDIDLTPYLQAWKSDVGGVGGYTKDVAQREQYLTNTTTNGKILYQTIEGLENGTYTVKLVANASYTAGRGFTSQALENEFGRVVVKANNASVSIPVVNQTAVATNNVIEFTDVIVTDGTLYIGLEKLAQGSNWHTIQITGLTQTSKDLEANETAYDEYWTTLKSTPLQAEAYANVLGAERNDLAAAATATEVMNTLAPFFDAKPAYDSLAEAIALAKTENVDVTEAEGIQTSPNTTAEIAAEAVHPLRLAYNTAKATEGADMTYAIVNPSFETGDTTGWTFEPSNDSGAKANSNGTYTMSGCDGNYLFNIWMSGNTISQKIADMPNGTYKLQAIIATDGGQKVQLNANTVNVQIDAVDKGTGVEGELEFDVLDNTITIGAEGVNKYWYKVDNFRLTYIKGFDLTELITAYQTALAEANAVEGKMNAATYEALDAARTTYAQVDETNADALTEATAALTEATAAAKASVAAYTEANEALEAMAAFVETTNFYTEEALNEYYTQWVSKYEDNTLTDTEAKGLQKPRTITGWHASVTVDNLLLSVWDTNPDFVNAPYYINTWSTEGESDGSEFHVPFFEYWTGDGDSLGERTLTGTIEGLEPGTYEVGAWVRARAKNGANAPAYGITMQVNDGEAVDVTEGEQVGTSQFYLGQYTAQGEVGEDGKLVLNFNVAADNNVSWLSFQNVVYTKVETVTVTLAGQFNWIEDQEVTAADELTVTFTAENFEEEGATVKYTVLISDQEYNLWTLEDEEVPFTAGEAVTVPFDKFEDSEEELGFSIQEGSAYEIVLHADLFNAEGTLVASIAQDGTQPRITVTGVAEPVEPNPNDYTEYIINPNLTDTQEQGWTISGDTKPIDGSGVLKVSSGKLFDINQTIHLPAGAYTLTAQAAYRYSSSEEQEYSAIQANDKTKYVVLYTTIGATTTTVNVMNRYDGASETDYAEGVGTKTVNGLFVPNSTAAVQAWFKAGEYVNTTTFVLTQDSDVVIGIKKEEAPAVGDYTVVGAWTLTREGDFFDKEVEINVERIVGQGYGAQYATADIDEAVSYLGVSNINEATLVIINPDGEEVANYAEYDGWFSTDGVATTWSTLNDNNNAAGINVKFFEALDGGTFSICDMNGADEVDATYTVKFALKANGKRYIYNINVTFVPAPVVDITYADLDILGTQDVNITLDLGTSYQGATADVDIAAALQALQVESLDDVTIYAVVPDGTLDLNYQRGQTDGWRNKEGNWQTWGDLAYYYVKADFTRESGQLYEVGTYHDKIYHGYTFVTKYVFVKNGSTTNEAYEVDVVIVYGDGVGINGIFAADEAEQTIYDMSGRRVRTITKGGMYIVNGKKVLVK